MDSRQTKNGWKIRDFIVELEPGTLHPQPRKFQAIKEAVDYLSDIPIGADVEVHFKMCGKQYKNTYSFYHDYTLCCYRVADFVPAYKADYSGNYF